MPVALDDGSSAWVEVADIDTSNGAFDYATTIEGDPFEAIARDALGAGIGREGPVGISTSYLCDAASLVKFAVDWLEAHFRSRTRKRDRAGDHSDDANP